MSQHQTCVWCVNDATREAVQKKAIEASISWGSENNRLGCGEAHHVASRSPETFGVSESAMAED